ncbi:MAG TPA: hypothetical protein DDX71_01380 [Ruminococcus sp.]|nr:hypothetical protein [Ruminococcus sp.]
MNKHLKGVIAAAMSVTMMAAAAAPAGSVLKAITPVKSITASASLGGEYNFSTIYEYVDYQGNKWEYGLNAAKTAACIYRLSTVSTSNVTVPSYVPNTSNGYVPVRAIDYNSVYGRAAIMTLTLPYTLQKLDSTAINNCQNLQEIVVTSTLTSVKTNSVYRCPNLTKVTYSGVNASGFEMFNSNPTIQNIGNMPLLLTKAGQLYFCNYYGFSDYIASHAWLFENQTWMQSYLDSYTSHYAWLITQADRTDAQKIGDICDFVSQRVNKFGIGIRNNARYNGDTTVFFNDHYNADSLACAKAFDLIATKAGFNTAIAKFKNSDGSAYEYFNVVHLHGFTYMIDAMRGSCMESFKRLNGFFSNNLPNDRDYATAAEIGSMHADPGNSHLVAVAYSFLGDVDNNGKLTYGDGNVLRAHINNSMSLTPYELFRADFNRDGYVTLDDADAMDSMVGEF